MTRFSDKKLDKGRPGEYPIGMKNQTYFEGLETLGAKAEARQARARRQRLVKQANEALYKLGLTYHESIPLADVDRILSAADLDPLEQMILCGREGRINEPVGSDLYLTLNWFKMTSGRYEIVAYIN